MGVRVIREAIVDDVDGKPAYRVVLDDDGNIQLKPARPSWRVPRIRSDDLRAAMAAFTDTPPHRRKQRIPPGPAARAAAAALRATAQHTPATTSSPADTTADTAGEVVVDLARYAAAAQGRNTLR